MQFIWTILIICAVSLLHVTSAQVTLTDSLEPGQSACPKGRVTFNCIVNGSRILSWSSIEYIGGGGNQLEFTTSNKPGDRMNSTVNPDTFAILTNVTVDGGTIILQSELHIVSNQSSEVSCLTTDTGSRQRINFNVFGDDPPGMPQNANAAAVEIPSGVERCVVFVEWDPPIDINSPNIDHYITQSSTKSENYTITETSILATFLSTCKELRNLYFNVTAVDCCKGVGVTTANFKPSLVVIDPSITSSQPSTTTTSTPAPEPILNGADIVAIIFSAAVLIIVVIIGIYYIIRKTCRNVAVPSERTPILSHPAQPTRNFRNPSDPRETNSY